MRISDEQTNEFIEDNRCPKCGWDIIDGRCSYCDPVDEPEADDVGVLGGGFTDDELEDNDREGD
jgi:hypothetical protein